jgi:hypothetical protein
MYYSGICLGGLRETTKHVSQDSRCLGKNRTKQPKSRMLLLHILLRLSSCHKWTYIHDKANRSIPTTLSQLKFIYSETKLTFLCC